MTASLEEEEDSERKKAAWLLAADEERRVQGKGRQRERGETALLRRLPVSAEGWQVRRFPGTRGETRNAESLALVERAVT